MGLFPEIQSPCPYKGKLSDIMDGDICRLCKKEVFDLTAMNDGERMSFMSGCTTDVCVSYRVKPNSLIAALALGASAVAVPAFAQSADTPDLSQEEQLAQEEMMIIVGGIRDPGKARWLSDRPVQGAPELPVIYEDAKPVTLNPDETPVAS